MSENVFELVAEVKRIAALDGQGDTDSARNWEAAFRMIASGTDPHDMGDALLVMIANKDIVIKPLEVTPKRTYYASYTYAPYSAFLEDKRWTSYSFASRAERDAWIRKQSANAKGDIVFALGASTILEDVSHE